MARKVDDVSAPRHVLWYRFVHRSLVTFALPFVRRKLNIKAERSDIRPKDASFIVFNHGCHYDFLTTNQILPVYSRSITTDAVLRKRLPRLILPLISDFIYRRKGERADSVVESAKLTIANGVHVHLSPEGNVTQNGASEAVKPRTGSLIKDSKAGLVTIRLKGNYLHSPFWAKNSDSDGPMYGGIVGVYSKEEIASMTPEEINALIARDLYINHYEWNKKERIVYDRKDRAECMERVAFMCPKCKSIGHLHSSHDTLSCDSCGYSVDVDEYGLFTGEDIAFEDLHQWDTWQKEELKSHRDEWISSGNVIVSFEHMKVQKMEGENPVIISSDALVSLSADELTIKSDDADIAIPTSEIISFTSLFSDTTGMNHNGVSYQFRSSVPASNRILRTVHRILKGLEE